MLPLYNLGVHFYFFLITIASFFNEKAKLFINGRKNIKYQKYTKSAWFHFASLGEFEQGAPVLSAFKLSHPDLAIIITFFSPSGFEVRKNTPLADAVYYLPLDTAANAQRFVEAINPTIAVFTKYEYWYHYFNELNKRNVPLYIISGIFRPKQIFFKWYGTLHRKMLGFVTRFFVQDENSQQLLKTIGVDNVTVSGDTRFDRVWANALNPKSFPLINSFKNGGKIFIAGSTWPEDEHLVAQLVSLYPDWKFIIVPHEISGEKINKLIGLLPANSSIRYSQFDPSSPTADHSPQTLIIDNIGMLSSLYQYGDIAYIGGGFGVGIHNTLEAAAFGLPVIFGPNYLRFKEACDLVELKAGFSINNIEELKQTVSPLIENENIYHETSNKIKEYVNKNTGATDMIIKSIKVKTA